MFRVAKSETLFEAPSGAALSEAGGDFSDLSLFAFFKVGDRLYARCKFRNEMTDEDSGLYLGSLWPGQWTAAVKLTEYAGDSSPCLFMQDDEPFAVWARGTGLQRAPSFLRDEIMSARVRLSDELSVGGFSVDLDNTSGMFTAPASKFPLYFKDDKSIALFLGFGGEFIRMMTAQVDETSAEHSPDDLIYSVQTANKYRDLLGLPLSKTYGMMYKSSGRQTMIAGFQVSAEIKAFSTVEVKLEAPAPGRWYPSSVKIENVVPASGLKFSEVFGQTETVAYIRITNETASPVQPVFDVTACPVLEEVIRMVAGSLTVPGGARSSTNFFEFEKYPDNSPKFADPDSLQVKLVNASGNVPNVPTWWKSDLLRWSIFSVLSKTPEMGADISLFSPAANMTGVQVVADQTASSSRTYYFEVYGRPYGSMIGDYWEAKDVLFDLVKMATHKETLLASRDGELGEGQNSKDFIIDFEEDIEPTTLRVEDLGNKETLVSIVEYTKRQAVVVVTRVGDTTQKIGFSFEVWGQYAGRLDFFSPMKLRITDPPTLKFSQPLVFDNEPIIDAAGKVRQVCFTPDGATYRFFMGARNDWRMVPFKIGDPLFSFLVRNMAKVKRAVKTPDLIDKVEIKGATTPLFISSTKMEMLHKQADDLVCPNFSGSITMTINFPYLIKPNTIELRNRTNGRLHLTERQPTFCKVKLSNGSFLNLGSERGKFEVWGEPFAGVVYQELYTVKTNANAVGKYKFTEATVENEMIDSEAVALQVADAVIEESAVGREKIIVEGIPHLGLEPCDTVEIVDEALGLVGARLIKGIDFSFEVTDKGNELRASYELQDPNPLEEGGEE